MKAAASLYFGRLGPPVAWLAATQLSQMTPHADCRLGAHWSAIAVSACVIVALGALAVTGMAAYAEGRFFDRLYTAIGAMFLLAILFQCAAVALLDPCLS